MVSEHEQLVFSILCLNLVHVGPEPSPRMRSCLMFPFPTHKWCYGQRADPPFQMFRFRFRAYTIRVKLTKDFKCIFFSKAEQIFEYLPYQHVKTSEDLDACNVWQNIQNKQ